MEDSERAEMEKEDGRAIPLDPRTMRSFASPATPDAIAAKAVQSSRPSSPAHDIRRWAKAFDGALPGRVLLDMERECRGSERKFLGMALARAKESQSGCLRSADDFMAAMEARRSRGSHGQGGGRFDAIGLMIEAGAFPRAIDSEGNSILHFMAVANLGAELESALLAMGPRGALRARASKRRGPRAGGVGDGLRLLGRDPSDGQGVGFVSGEP